MFTGIITHITPIKDSHKIGEGLRIILEKPQEWSDLVLGESIATNGACLTVSSFNDTEYEVFLMPETLEKTIFGQQVPAKVNLERSLSAADRFGGHFVQGHVDGVGQVARIDETDGYRLYISFDKANAPLVIPKGSVTINGVSLTVVDAKQDELSVALIPHTLQHTTLGDLRVGDPVNLEFDMIGKYIVRNMAAYMHQDTATGQGAGQ
jgi:riboflavin synthase